jgi:hypothetical protein
LPGRSPAEAVNNFLQPLQLALSCVTPDVVDVRGGYYPAEAPHVAALHGGLPVALPGGQLSLTVAIHYRVVEDEGPRGPWKVSTAAYIYALHVASELLLAYHWHPAGRSAATRSHLHLVPGVDLLQRVHLPTGRVALEQVLQLAIAELDVRPRRGDWSSVLESTQAAFEEWRSWA